MVVLVGQGKKKIAFCSCIPTSKARLSMNTSTSKMHNFGARGSRGEKVWLLLVHTHEQGIFTQ